MLSEEREPLTEQGCWVSTCSGAVVVPVTELLTPPLEWSEPSDRRELLAGEPDELAVLSPGQKREREEAACSMSHFYKVHRLLRMTNKKTNVLG